MFKGYSAQAVRLRAAAILLAATVVSLLATSASGEDSLSDLKARMRQIRAGLDAVTAKVEALHAREEELETRIDELRVRKGQLEDERVVLQKAAIERADALYRAGGTGEMVEVLFGSEDLTELETKLEVLSRLSLDDTGVFVRLARSDAELDELAAELDSQQQRLDSVTASLQDAAAELRDKLRLVSDEYEELRRRIAQEQEAQQPQVTAAPAPVKPVVLTGTDDMVCPVAGPVSFIDSWGYPRSGGRSHQGVDMMADYGTPAVAIVDGNITTSSVHALAGNYLVLTGDNGHQYYYAHNQRNIVTGGHVSAGEVIAEVGDTGNATGVPHLHFEFHPGGGAAVNPFPLVASIC